jgi:GTP-binding protein
MLITSLDFSAFTGRIAIGRLERGIERRNANFIGKRRFTIWLNRVRTTYFCEGLVVVK